MPILRAVVCLLLLLCWGESLAQPSSSRPARGVPGPRPALAGSKELYQALDSVTQTDAKSVVAWICPHSLSLSKDGTFQLYAPKRAAPPPSAAACPTQPYQEQPSLAFCSGVLVTSQIVATSAACVERAKRICGGSFAGPGSTVRAIFGYAMESEGASLPPIPASDIFVPQRILKQTTGRAQNWMLVELNRPVGDRAVPLRLDKPRAGSSVQVIGHPQGLPSKVTTTPLITNDSALSFTVAPGVVGQSPGSPVFSTGSTAVAGIVASDPVSWNCPSGAACCQFSPKPGQGTSATIIRASAIAQALCAKGQTLCGTSCVDTTSDALHCGRCDKACALPHALSGCRTGGCRVTACEPGWADCDKVAANGCEVQLGTNSNCAACGNTCDLANANEACMGGSCQVVSCSAGFGNCDGKPANGCETPLGTINNCSACNARCEALPNTVPSCVEGGCQWSCKLGWSDCNNSPGCETAGNCAPTCSASLCDDSNACTVDACDTAGACTHTAVSCDDGNPCTQDTCSPTSGCNHSPQPGAACTSDSNACTNDVCDSTGTCTHPNLCNDGNACTTDTCDPATGCKNTPISCDDGNACTTDSCNPTTGCVRTNAPYNAPCPGNASNCTVGYCNGYGTCYQSSTCGGNRTCSGGDCVCSYPNQMCDGYCTDTKYDWGNCGFCGHQCQNNEYCSNGICRCTTTSPYSPLREECAIDPPL